MISDGHASLFRPQPAPGQWWAVRIPVGLSRIVTVEAAEIAVKIWSATDPGVLWSFPSAVFDMRGNEYLWFEESFPQSLWFDEESHRGHPPPSFGQAYISARDERIFFVGPQESPHYTKILASWPVSEKSFRKAILYQDYGRAKPSANETDFYSRELLTESFG